MVPEDKLNEFVGRMREAAGQNLESVILFGSAVSGDFHAGTSNLNLFCVLRDASLAALDAAAPVAQWWEEQKYPLPLLMTHDELVRSCDVFAIELLDMQQRHRVLYGIDPFTGLVISPPQHRAQLEYELREKLILLRQQVLRTIGSDARLWELLARSASSFGTLFRHALIVLGQPAPSEKRGAVQALAKVIGFDPSAMLLVLNIRQGKADRANSDVRKIFSEYLAIVEQVTFAVDRAEPI